MSVQQRGFNRDRDFEAISRFLIRHHRPGNRDGNWLQPIWEYAYTHPMFDETILDRITLWEDAGEIVGFVTAELFLGDAFLHVHPDYAHLKPEMLARAEETLFATGKKDGRRYLNAFVYSFDHAFERHVAERGYQRHEAGDRPMSTFEIPAKFPPIPLPEDFRLQSVADDNDPHKLCRVLHRGFDHPGEPSAKNVEQGKKMQSGPNFRPDLTMVTVAPDGQFVSYCGMWYDAANRYAYVEPVATDPDYRRRGLGRAAVLEAIRRAGQFGATVAYVAAIRPFYLSFGFRQQFNVACWRKALPDV